jgi:L-serine dehydratase
MNSIPGIFNDVIGHVMLSPDSSYCDAALLIGIICRDLMDGNLENSFIEYDSNGPLPTSHKSKGYDLGIFGGFIGWEAFNDRLPPSENFLESKGIFVHIDIIKIQETHSGLS